MRRNSITSSSPIRPPKKRLSPSPVFSFGDRNSGWLKSEGFSSIQTFSSFCHSVNRPLVCLASLITSAKGRSAAGGAAAGGAAPGAAGGRAAAPAGMGVATPADAGAATAPNGATAADAPVGAGTDGTAAHPASSSAPPAAASFISVP